MAMVSASLKRHLASREGPVNRSIIVRAMWDEEAKVWVAESDDVAGLATEADSFEELREKVLAMIPELLELNGISNCGFAEIPVHLMAEQCARIRNPLYR